MEISGHRTRSIFDRYNIVSERDKQDVLRRTHDYLLGFCFQEVRSGRNAKGGRPMNCRTLVGHCACRKITKEIRPEITGLFSMKGWLRGPATIPTSPQHSLSQSDRIICDGRLIKPRLPPPSSGTSLSGRRGAKDYQRFELLHRCNPDRRFERLGHGPEPAVGRHLDRAASKIAGNP
jgi:hypothetical protein